MSRPQRPSRPRERTEEDEDNLRENLGAVGSFLGPAQPMPEDFKEGIAFAEEILKKMHPGKA